MSDTIKAALWMIGAVVSFSSMAIAGRAISLNLDTFEIMMFRSLLGIVIVVTVAKATGAFQQVTRRHLGLHMVRNLFHFAGQNLWFYSITVIPLAQVFALEFTSPLWVIILSPFFLGEKITSIRALAAVIGFVGILIVTRPTADTLELGQLTAALAAIGFAGSAVFTRKLTRSETTVCILFWLTVMQAVFGLICAGYDGDIALPTTANIPWLLLISVAGLVAHYCLTTALSLAPATVVMPIDFARLPLIAVVGMIFYNEGLDIYVLIGAAVIFGGNYLNIWSNMRQKTR